MTFAQRLKPSHLALAIRIAETGKLQLAAARSAMSQPAASRILADMEHRAGAALFERTPTGMTPTPVGAAVIAHGRAILEGLDNLDREIETLNTGRAGIVRIGTVTGPAVGSVVPAIRSVKARALDLEVTVEVLPSVPLISGLIDRQFDYVLCRVPHDVDARMFDLTPSRVERVDLLVQRDHPLAGQRDIRLGHLVDNEWIIQERGSPVRGAVEDAFRWQGLEMPARVTNSSSLLVALAMLEGSSAISPQSREVARLMIRQGRGRGPKRLDLHERITVPPFFLIRRKAHQLSRAAEIVLDEILLRL